MKKELCVKQIYNDFTDKVVLTDIEKQVLDLYIKNESIVKIADAIMQGTATVSRVIFELKEKYKNYKKLEIAKLNIFENKWYKCDNLYHFLFAKLK